MHRVPRVNQREVRLDGIGLTNTKGDTLKDFSIHRGMNRREAERAVVRVGGTIIEINGTGERRMFHPCGGYSCRYSVSRKDLPRSVLVWLKRLFGQHRLDGSRSLAPGQGGRTSPLPCVGTKAVGQWMGTDLELASVTRV
jgi:hypothetical protein